jgi:hypothetical protein
MCNTEPIKRNKVGWKKEHAKGVKKMKTSTEQEHLTLVVRVTRSLVLCLIVL